MEGSTCWVSKPVVNHHTRELGSWFSGQWSLMMMFTELIAWLQLHAKLWASSIQFSRSLTSNSLRPHGLQNARLPCPSPTPRVYSNSCPSNHRWCHPTISSSVTPFCSCLQSFPASGSLPMSQFFTSGVQSIGVSASEIPLELNGLISLQSKGLSRIFSNTTVQKYQFFSAQLSL